jgi:hypothetical protein
VRASILATSPSISVLSSVDIVFSEAVVGSRESLVRLPLELSPVLSASFCVDVIVDGTLELIPLTLSAQLEPCVPVVEVEPATTDKGSATEGVVIPIIQLLSWISCARI